MDLQLTLSPRQAAQRLGISLNAIYALVWAGKIPAEQVQGRWRLSTPAVEERFLKHYCADQQTTKERE